MVCANEQASKLGETAFVSARKRYEARVDFVYQIGRSGFQPLASKTTSPKPPHVFELEVSCLHLLTKIN